MIILITGKPGIGKSTILQKLVDGYSMPSRWVVTQEIRNEAGERVGFRATRENGASRVISHKHDIASGIVVGRNQVDVGAIDEIFDDELCDAPLDVATFIDEIGPIQLSSRHFAQSMKRLFADPSARLVVASIHQSHEQIARYRNLRKSLIISVNEKNRDFLQTALGDILTHHETIDALSPAYFERFRTLLLDYLDTVQPVQLAKLLEKAISYVEAGAVKRQGLTKYRVIGKHGIHIVSKCLRVYSCDCDLFNGKGIYAGKPGICSHIQAVQIKY